MISALILKLPFGPGRISEGSAQGLAEAAVRFSAKILHQGMLLECKNGTRTICLAMALANGESKIGP
jgi:hypothetical protein